MARLTFIKRNQNSYEKAGDVSESLIEKYTGMLPDELIALGGKASSKNLKVVDVITYIGQTVGKLIDLGEKLLKNGTLLIGKAPHIAVVLATMSSCKSVATITEQVQDVEPVTKRMTLTSNKPGDILIHMAGSGTITIDWGNGKECETHTLSNYEENFTSLHRYSHYYSYSDTSLRTITIVGENITHLNSVGNQLTTLNVSDNNALIGLWCNEKQLTNLDISNNTALKLLWVIDGSLTNLDVSNNTALTSLICNGNRLRNLDVSRNTELIELSCYSNQLRSLDLSKNTALAILDCSHNQLSAAALDALFETLHSNSISGGKTIYTRHNPGIVDYDTTIATRKEWLVLAN